MILNDEFSGDHFLKAIEAANRIRGPEVALCHPDRIELLQEYCKKEKLNILFLATPAIEDPNTCVVIQDEAMKRDLLKIYRMRNIRGEINVESTERTI